MEEEIVSSDGVAYTEGQLLHLVSEIKDYQLTHGALLKTVQQETESSVPARPVGVSILPTAFPRKAFEEAVELQQIFNELYIRVASDPDWLYEVLGPLTAHDAFIAALWDIYEKVRDAGAIQDTVCGVFRSDYMLHQPIPNTCGNDVQLKQVEINTFSAAGACHAERVANMQRSLAQQVRGMSLEDAMYKLPNNKNTMSIVNLLEAADSRYQLTVSERGSRQRCILMPVQPYNFNIADERPIQYGLWDKGISCYRCEWPMITRCTTLLEDHTLLYHPPLGNSAFEVSVVYYRAGYDAEEYNETGKETRLQLEMSRAMKCPDVLTHMTNMKAVQQALSMPGALEHFLPHEKCESLKKTFMSMQVLDSTPDGLEACRIAQNPELAANYVLKPNRDGGGHNVYRSDISSFLVQKAKESWRKYVLMRLIEPPATTGALMTLEELYVGEVISELGILGTCLWRREPDGDGGSRLELICNEVAGWTFKTKPHDVDEMSVVKGYGCFDCPLLVD